MTSEEIRKRFLAFFEKRGHAIILSASLVPENDPSVLFNTAGMQPLVPYLMGEKHPKGDRIVDIQKCVRTGDIDEVGDNTHLTFFEMMGNWSLGSYFKKEAISWSYEFLTSKKDGLGLDPNRLYITCFEGDDNAPRDDESAEIWMSLGVPKYRIYFLGSEDNWWSAGDNGPCGPDSEMFYDVIGSLGDMSFDEFKEADDKQEIVEIWNDVFMEYEKRDGKVIGKLSQKNVDTGAGLERVTMMMQGKDNPYDTDLFETIMAKAKLLSSDPVSQRIISDHIRTAVFMIADGVTPSNTDQGYILRRLIRRAVMRTDDKNIEDIRPIVAAVIDKYSPHYVNLSEKDSFIMDIIGEEILKFGRTIQKGLREFEKLPTISGNDAFVLFSTYGFPLELTVELAKERDISVDVNAFNEEFKEHQKLSRSGAEQKFKGGLADHDEMSIKYHTATHLLHKALIIVLGDSVAQKGSNITTERLRFDFTFGRKMTDEEKEKVTEIVNEQIKKALPVTHEDMTYENAEKSGAIGLFKDKYEDVVRVYRVGDFSVEICGGPHVKNTSELGEFKIKKEESIAAGIRRIKAVLV